MSGWTLDRGRIIVDERLRAGSSDEVRTGHLAADPDVRFLVALTAQHPANALARWRGFEEVDYVGPTDPGVPYSDALVEVLPPGEPAHAPRSEHSVIALGHALASYVARAHERGRRVGGIYPELVYVRPNDELSGVCPNGPEFIATAPQPMHGPRSYRMPFVAFEALALGKPELASDVFATCATLFFLREGHHPFGDDVLEMLKRMDRDEPDRLAGGAELAAVIAAGLARAPARRPSAAELASTLRRLL